MNQPICHLCKDSMCHFLSGAICHFLFPTWLPKNTKSACHMSCPCCSMSCGFHVATVSNLSDKIVPSLFFQLFHVFKGMKVRGVLDLCFSIIFKILGQEIFGDSLQKICCLPSALSAAIKLGVPSELMRMNN